MARIRTIKPEFWTSDPIMSCSRDARLLFIGMWNFADDNGVLSGSELSIKAKIFPSDDIRRMEIRNLIDELIFHELLDEFLYEEKKFLAIRGWKDHQKIDKPNPKPEFLQEFTHYSENIRRTFVEHSSNIRVGNGREWKGMEGKRNISPGDYCKNKHCEIEISQDKFEIEPEVLIENPSELTETGIESKKEVLPISTYHSNSSDALEVNSVGFNENEKKVKKSDEKNKNIELIFEHWKLVMNHKNAKLDSYRKRFIDNALKNYSVNDICNAITGCSYTPHNMGNNFDGGTQIYDGLHIILKNSENIDRFINNCHNPPTKKGWLSSCKKNNNEEEALKALEKLGRR